MVIRYISTSPTLNIQHLSLSVRKFFPSFVCVCLCVLSTVSYVLFMYHRVPSFAVAVCNFIVVCVSCAACHYYGIYLLINARTLSAL